MSLSNDSRYFCGGRLFTIFSFSHCLACLIAPCMSALAHGLFCSSNCKGKYYMALLVLEMGLKPSEKNSLPWFHTYPAHSLDVLVSSITSNLLLTTRSWISNCCALPAARGAGPSDQCWVFQLMVLCHRPIYSYREERQQLPELLPLSFSSQK